MRRLAEWTKTEGFAFAATTAILALLIGLGAFFAGRLWIGRYIAEHERTAPTQTLPQPSEAAATQPTPATLSPRVVIREREPTEAERRAIAEETGQPPAEQTETGSAEGTVPEVPASSAAAPEASPSAGASETVRSGASADASSPSSGSAGSWTATAGSYRDRRNAEQVVANLQAQGLEADIQAVTVRGQTFYRVRAGTFASKGDAEAAARKVEAAGYPSQVLGEQ